MDDTPPTSFAERGFDPEDVGRGITWGIPLGCMQRSNGGVSEKCGGGRPYRSGPPVVLLWERGIQGDLRDVACNVSTGVRLEHMLQPNPYEEGRV